MIVCSCNILTEREWEDAARELCPSMRYRGVKRFNKAIWKKLDKKPGCKGCISGLSRITSRVLNAYALAA